MHKDLETLGKNLPTDSSMTFAGRVEAPSASSCQQKIAAIFRKLLRNFDSYPVVATYTTQDDPTKLTIIVTYYVPKRIHEKNGAT
jgi:hypothetical protein